MSTPSEPGAPRPAAARLLGRWRLLRADANLDFAPGVSMEFRAGGRLLYGFDVGENRQTIQLVYRVEGDILHTDHTGTTHEVATRFEFGPGEVLIFDFGGQRAWFVKELQRGVGSGQRER
ncbi:MAG: hypothetical protein ACT4P7_02925 [Gemmatimonadaceae bacterium]